MAASALVCIANLQVVTAYAQSLRPWTAADSANRQTILQFDATGDVGEGWLGSGGLVRPSPDGRYYVLIFDRGNMQQDASTALIQIYRTEDIRSAVSIGRKPNVLHELSITRSSRIWLPYSIAGVAWDSAGDGLVLSAEDARGIVQGYRVDLSTGKLTDVTHSSQDVLQFQYRGGNSLFGVNITDPVRNIRYPLEPVPRVNLPTHPNEQMGMSRRFAKDFLPKYFVRVGDSEPVEIQGGLIFEPKLSPTGEMAAWPEADRQNRAIYRVVRLTPKGAKDEFKIAVSVRDVSNVFWTGDGSELILLGSFEGEGRGIFSYAVNDKTLRKIGELKAGVSVDSLKFENDRLTVGLRENGSGSSITLERREGRWTTGGTQAASPPSVARAGVPDFDISIRQDRNSAPRYVARLGKRELEIGDEDPAMRGVAYTPRTMFSWTDAEGRQWNSRLALPAGRGPFPVVVQPFIGSLVDGGPDSPSYFAPDGANSTSDATQALVARGIAVVMLDITDLARYQISDANAAEREIPRSMLRVEALIDALTARHIADPQRVGISGFSRGGFHSFSLLVRPRRTRFAAAAVSDSFLYPFSEYLEKHAIQGQGGYSSYGNGQPFWGNEKEWLERDVLFNVDRLETPVSFAANLSDTPSTADYPRQSVDLIGAFVANDKPLDYMMMLGSGHSLVWPLQRRSYLEHLVDWFSFWLLGEEDPSPAKTAQYRRWNKYRADWRGAQATSYPGARPDDGFIVTRSGLAYRLVERNAGSPPSDGDMVTVEVDRMDTAGDSSNSAAPVVQTVQMENSRSPFATASSGDLGQAWKDLLRLVHVGERVEVVLPAKGAILPDGTSVQASGPVRLEIRVRAFEQATSGAR